MRIVITGNSGSGKSTLAIKLGSVLDTGVIHMDELYWIRDGEHIPESEFVDVLQRELARDKWICEGYHVPTLALRADAADLIVLLDVPARTCLRRLMFKRGKRPGVPWRDRPLAWKEHIRFLRWIAIYATDRRPRLRGDLQAYNDKLVVLKRPRDVRALVRSARRDDWSAHAPGA